MQLTPLGPEFESIIAATVMFLAGGALSFICCFCITHGYIWHKRRIYRNRLRHEWSEDTESTSTDLPPNHVYVQKSLPAKQYVVVDRQQPQNHQLKRVIVVAKPISDEKPPPNSAVRSTQQQHGQKTTEKTSMLKHSQQDQKRVPNGRNANVAFECGSSTEETNSS